MAEVAAAARAEHLCPHHPVARVGLLLDGGLVRGRGERRPAAAGVVLRLRLEQRRAAAGAAVGAGLEDVVVLAAERRLGSLLPQDVVLLRRERLAPLPLGFLDLGHGQGIPDQTRPTALPRTAGDERAAQPRRAELLRAREALLRDGARRPPRRRDLRPLGRRAARQPGAPRRRRPRALLPAAVRRPSRLARGAPRP